MFLRVLWAVFFVVALVGGSLHVPDRSTAWYMKTLPPLLFEVITTTKINRETNMTLPAIRFCENDGHNS